MKRFGALVLTFGCLSLIGCNREPAKPPAGNGVHITAPGVNVQTDANGGVGVKAPGVNVNVNPPK